MPTAQTILDRKGTAVATIDGAATVLEAAKLMNARRIGAVVVTSGAHVVGIFTERDILNRIVAAARDAGTTRVSDVMTSPMACCQRDTKLAECKAVMTNQRIRHLPVVEEGKLFGLISIGDILASETVDQQATIQYLHEYLYGRS
ncbi:MAG: CBS domain-containing protein [Planctomycetes bacterium]|nr:CBS domain-containing protein [Planctomycetota bacterium]